MNTFFAESPRASVQNRVQNCEFSENLRWGPYKNIKNVTKTHEKFMCCSTGSAASRCAVRDRFGRRARSVCRGRSYLNDAHKHARTASPYYLSLLTFDALSLRTLRALLTSRAQRPLLRFMQLCDHHSGSTRRRLCGGAHFSCIIKLLSSRRFALNQWRRKG